MRQAARPTGQPAPIGGEVIVIGVSVLRAMNSSDLPDVLAVTNAAFRTRESRQSGRAAGAGQMVPPRLFGTRFATDPGGCFVAVNRQGAGRVAGALISRARGTAGWLGPLAVHPDAQRSGIGGRLVTACIDSWRRRGVRLMGLETYRDSPSHRLFYEKLGFQPSCAGIGFRGRPARVGMPAGVEIDGRMPDISFLYPGLDVSAEAAAVKQCGTGHALTTGDGIAILHLESTVQPPGAGFVPFLAAATRDSFDKLLGAAEYLSHRQGKTSLLTRTSSSSWTTIETLLGRGYQAEALTLRMKAGENTDYDHTTSYYLDNWL